VLPFLQDAFVGARTSSRASWLNTTKAELRKLVIPLIAFSERSNARDRSSGNNADALQFAAILNWELKAAVVYERNPSGAFMSYLRKIRAGSANDDTGDFIVLGCHTHGLDNYVTEVDPQLGRFGNHNSARTLKNLIHSEKMGIIHKAKSHSTLSSYFYFILQHLLTRSLRASSYNASR